jgi:hypothetical protein
MSIRYYDTTVWTSLTGQYLDINENQPKTKRKGTMERWIARREEEKERHAKAARRGLQQVLDRFDFRVNREQTPSRQNNGFLRASFN